MMQATGSYLFPLRLAVGLVLEMTGAPPQKWKIGKILRHLEEALFVRGFWCFHLAAHNQSQIHFTRPRRGAQLGVLAENHCCRVDPTHRVGRIFMLPTQDSPVWRKVAFIKVEWTPHPPPGRRGSIHPPALFRPAEPAAYFQSRTPSLSFDEFHFLSSHHKTSRADGFSTGFLR